MKPVLRIPTYRRLLAAYALNELAFMIGSVALALLVYRRTGSALGATAFFLSAQFVPALFSPMTVARLDQLRARVVLPVLHGFEAAIFVVLAWVASSHFSVAAVLVLAFLDGTIALTARALTRAATVSVTRPPISCARATRCRTPPSRCASCSVRVWAACSSRRGAPAPRCSSTPGCSRS